MRYEPRVDHEQLARAVFEAYRVKARALTFIPVGFEAACYRLRSRDHDYFLKLWPAGADAAARRRRGRSLRLARALHDRDIYPQVAYPLPAATGALATPFADGELALFPFLEGSPPPVTWPDALQDQWVRAFVRIHRATPQLADVLPDRERFALDFLSMLRRCLRRLELIGPAARAGQQVACERVAALRPDIEAQIARLAGLQASVQRLPSPFVLCHTDMGGDNLLIGEGGRLYLLDWDWATVAPPEYDLHEARWVDFERIVRGYRAAGGATPLYRDQFAFCILRRALGDMTARLERLASADATDAEDADMLHGVEAWGVRQWQALDATLAPIGPLLD